MLADLGFDIDVFGPNTIKISKIPMIVKKLASNDLLLDLLDGTLALHKQVHALDDLKDRVITRMACRAADKAGDELSDERMKQLIRWISLAKFKYQCPHGRPTMIELSEYELDKLFKRKV
jgi:DNA mismatch repair protein MutL